MMIVLCVQMPLRGQSGSADIAALQQRSQAIQAEINDAERQLLLIKQQHKQITLEQQISGEFATVFIQG